MGADGGVCWVELREGATLDDLERLLAPWWYDLTNLGSRTYEDSRRAWIAEQGHEHPRAVFGGYGTDLPDDLTWRDLDAWVREVDDAITDPARGLPEGATFGDYLGEVDTRGSGWWTSGDASSAAVQWEDTLRRHGQALLPMRLDAWVEGVRGALVSTHASSVGTWT